MQSLKDLVASQPYLVVGHRGASSEAPENTLAAMTLALQSGVAMIEIDVQISADGQVVVFHDETLERTSNGRGFIRHFSYEELKKLDAGCWFAEKFRGERIPLLTEVFALLRGRGCVNVEIKPPSAGENWQKRVELIARTTAAAEMIPFTLFSSFHHESLTHLNALQQGFHTAALLPPGDERLPSQVLRATSSEGFVCSLAQLTPERAADIARHEIFTGVYTINTIEDAELALAGKAKAIVTDCPGFMIKQLRMSGG
ncbi:MAG: hypothetical protein HY885_02865 [Deltaproteobacteria bacterium]|nr:hypothetical protein [Deltaproteobacteria bacterium]